MRGWSAAFVGCAIACVPRGLFQSWVPEIIRFLSFLPSPAYKSYCHYIASQVTGSSLHLTRHVIPTPGGSGLFALWFPTLNRTQNSVKQIPHIVKTSFHFRVWDVLSSWGECLWGLCESILPSSYKKRRPDIEVVARKSRNRFSTHLYLCKGKNPRKIHKRLMATLWADDSQPASKSFLLEISQLEFVLPYHFAKKALFSVMASWEWVPERLSKYRSCKWPGFSACVN